MSSFFGTDGIRASMGTALFTQDNLPSVAHAISRWLNDTYKKDAAKPRVLIIYDTRNSCAYIKSVFKMVFLSASIDVFDAGVLPTPAAAYLIKKYGYSCALIISASHNPWHDNGIKIMDASGKLSPQAEQIITEYINHPAPTTINYLDLGNETIINGLHEYHDALAQFFKPNFLRSTKIVIDCAHGATSTIAPAIFKYLGAETITLNNQPNGFNINEQCGSLTPQKLQEAVAAHGADIGFAFDGDGDRVIAVNRSGHLKNGDDILALLSQHPDYADQKVVVGTIMSNVGLQSWLNKQNKKLLRTAVGDKYVAQVLHEQHLLMGGEQSGHILLKNYTNTGDGILVALKTLEALTILDNKDFETFAPFPQILLTVPVKKMCDLSENPYDILIEQAEKLIPCGRISVRYSGTEKNMLRIMVESELLHDARTIAHDLAASLQKELS
jgi:phosphoglucosamine mutase